MRGIGGLAQAGGVSFRRERVQRLARLLVLPPCLGQGLALGRDRVGFVERIRLRTDIETWELAVCMPWSRRDLVP